MTHGCAAFCAISSSVRPSPHAERWVRSQTVGTCDLTSLSLSFLICAIGMVMVLISQSYCEDGVTMGKS